MLSWGFFSWETNLRLESKDEKARKVLELADEICYLDSKGNEILGGGFKYFYFDPYLGKITMLTNIFERGWNHQLEFVKAFWNLSSHVLLFGEFFECVVFFLLFWLFLGFAQCWGIYVGCVFGKQNLFSFYTMLTLYQAVRQGRNTVDSTGNLRYNKCWW